jgi:hypothetical protein
MCGFLLVAQGMTKGRAFGGPWRYHRRGDYLMMPISLEID